MSVRIWINEHSALVTIVMIVILIGALVAVISNVGGSRQGDTPRKRWYYDLTARTLFSDDIDRISPFKTEAGHEAVQAVVFHCGSCSEPPQIAYLQKYTLQAAKQMQKQWERMQQGLETTAWPDGLDLAMASELVSSVDKIEWVNLMKPKANTIVRDSIKCPEGVKPVLTCFPED